MDNRRPLPTPPSREVEIWSATRTLAMHLRGGRCAMCTRDGCRLKTWAETIRRQAEREGYPVPEVGPVPTWRDDAARGIDTPPRSVP